MDQNLENERNAITESTNDIAVNAPVKRKLKPRVRGAKKGAYVFFALCVLTFAAYLIFTIPFLDLFFNHTAKDFGDAMGQAFGLIFTILMMGIIGIPHVIFSLVSTISFGTAIGKTEGKTRTKMIVFFILSLALLLAAVLIAVISFIVMKNQ